MLREKTPNWVSFMQHYKTSKDALVGINKFDLKGH